MDAEFLHLPPRDAKPRAVGVTAAIDGGLPAREVEALLAAGAAYLDLWKFGWGTAYVDPGLPEKLRLLRRHGIASCPGGTLLEVAGRQGRAGDCLDWYAEIGVSHVEVSDGLGGLPRAAKRELIARAGRRFTVWSEVGSKDPAVLVDAAAWVRAVADDLEAGASRVVVEGRESGTVGLFLPDRSVRVHLVDALVHRFGPEPLVFEAPRRDQQAWFVRHLGPEVNLANVDPREAIAVETLRLGLRADTAAPRAPVTNEVESA